MGQEARCRVRFADQLSEGKALLEATELIFRGDFRLRIPLQSIADLVEDGDDLRVAFADRIATFELGAKTAAKWASIIRNPKGLLEKLGVTAGSNVVVLGIDDDSFRDDLLRAGVSISDLSHADIDVIFYGADVAADLRRLADLKARMKPNGAVWVVSPKGKNPQLRDTEIMAAAREAGLVDTKVASFSDTHTALKLVIPKDQRTSRQSPVSARTTAGQQ